MALECLAIPFPTAVSHRPSASASANLSAKRGLLIWAFLMISKRLSSGINLLYYWGAQMSHKYFFPCAFLVVLFGCGYSFQTSRSPLLLKEGIRKIYISP